MKERIINDDYFSSGGAKDALWVVLNRKEDLHLSPEIKELWMKTVFREPEAGEKSSFRRHHRPIFYEAVMDLKLREVLLNDAFGSC